MKIKAILPVQHFILEEASDSITVDSMILGKPRVNTDSFYSTKALQDQFGELDMVSMDMMHTILILPEASILASFPRIYQAPKIAEQLTGIFSSFLLGLWFVSDNSVCVSTCRTIDTDTGAIGESTRHILYSNSEGLYTPTKFSVSSLTKAFEFISLIRSLRENEDHDLQLYNETNEQQNSTQVGNSNFIAYNKNMNRLSRALRFLEYARANSFLPQKISFYVCVLECLFTSDPGEITHKICERATLFIGGTAAEKLDNFQMIKKAYKIRSAYFHGSYLKDGGDFVSLRNLSSRLDAFLRPLLATAISTNKETFLLPADKLTEKFNEMIFR